MKENKFRSYNAKDKRFYYFVDGRYYNDIPFRGGGLTCISERICKEFDWNNADQYIGTKDKSSNEVYECDILKSDHGFYPVTFDEKEQQFIAENNYAYIDPQSIAKYEIVGTKHENNDLLQG